MEKIKVFKYHYGKWLHNGFITEPNTETKSKPKNNIQEQSKTTNPS